MYGTEPLFWVKLFFLIGMVVLALFIFNQLIGKWLKVNKKLFSSQVHLNIRHKKIDWTIRVVCILFLIAGSFINAGRENTERLWYFEIYFIMFLLIVLTESVQAYMERRYSENRNDYIYTLCQLGFLIVIVISVVITDFFSLF